METEWCDNCVRIRPVVNGHCIQCNHKMSGVSTASFNTNTLLFIAALLFLGYFFYLPYLTVNKLGEGISQRDAELLEQTIDFPAVRQDLKQQLNARMASVMSEDDAMQDNPFAGLALTLASSMIEGMLDLTMTPDGMASMLKHGDLQSSRHPAEAGQGDPFVDARLRYDSISRFSIRVPNDNGGETRLQMSRNGLVWKVTRIELPLDDSAATEL